jgi:hypothetical protein
MKALSGYAEWFWLMAKNWKDVENRPKPLPHELASNLPERIYLHASKSEHVQKDYSTWYFILKHLTPDQEKEFLGVDWHKLRGCIIGEISITNQFKKQEVRESDHVDIGSQMREAEILIANKAPCKSPWFFGPFGYAVKDGVLYEKPIPYRGQLGFFEVQI